MYSRWQTDHTLVPSKLTGQYQPIRNIFWTTGHSYLCCCTHHLLCCILFTHKEPFVCQTTKKSEVSGREKKGRRQEGKMATPHCDLSNTSKEAKYCRIWRKKQCQKLKMSITNSLGGWHLQRPSDSLSLYPLIPTQAPHTDTVKHLLTWMFVKLPNLPKCSFSLAMLLNSGGILRTSNVVLVCLNCCLWKPEQQHILI